MEIEFTEKWSVNMNFGINFQAIVDGESVVCEISLEALDDIDPSNRGDEPEDKFQNNRAQFEKIAYEKIINNELTNGKVLIKQSDVV